MTIPSTISTRDEATIECIADVVDRRHVALFVTGAGMSAESGLPTYRGVGGLYVGADGSDSAENILTGAQFRRQPELVWRHLGRIESACRGARHNRGHQVIAEMQGFFQHVCVLTQNIDGFHLDAGSKDVIEIHGNLRRLVCMKCDYKTQVRDYSGLEIPPRCPQCQAMLRPAVVLFEEMLQDEPVDRMMRRFAEGFDIVFSIGTTSVFPYIAEPIHWARRNARPSIEINPDETAVSGVVEHRLALPAAVALDRLWQVIQSR